MYKKILSLSLAIALIFATSACNRPVGKMPRLDPNNPVAITIWHYYNGAQKQAFDTIVAEFNDSVGRDKGIIIEAISQGGVNELANKLIASAKKEPGADELPDIFGAYSDTIYDLDRMGMVAALDEYIDEDETGKYVESFVKESRSLPGGQFKIFPLAKSTEILYVNKTDWDKFVYAVTDDDRSNKYEDVSDELLSTWEGIYKAAEVYYKWTDDSTPSILEDGKALFGIDSVANFQLVANKQLGVEFLSVEGGRGAINIDETAQKKIWDFYNKGMVNGYFEDFGRFRSDDVKTGNLLMYIGSSSAGAYMPTQVTLSDGYTYPIKSTILPLPVFQGGERVAVQQGAGLAVKKSTPKEEYACMVFLKYFIETKSYIDFIFNSSYIPVSKDIIESKELWDSLRYLKESGDEQQKNIALAIEASLIQLKDYEMYYPTPFPGSYEVRKTLESRTTDSLKGEREKILDKVRNGVPVKEAAREQLNSDSFSEYIRKMKKDIQKALEKSN